MICLVYDSTSQKSFDALARIELFVLSSIHLRISEKFELNFWVEEIKQRVDMDTIQIYVVASKVDN